MLFVDTDEFRLYNNAFILRRRIPYKDGFPIGEPEIVFKFRHPDMQVAAETDVRPNILGDHRVKFKAQALPLKEKLGGIRCSSPTMCNSTVRPSAWVARTSATWTLLSMSCLSKVRKTPKEHIHLVSNTIVEEVLQDIGSLDFGDGLTCKANVAIWRTRGERPLIGEFAYQFRFQDRNLLSRMLCAGPRPSSLAFSTRPRTTSR